jgi:hypothetical protein
MFSIRVWRRETSRRQTKTPIRDLGKRKHDYNHSRACSESQHLVVAKSYSGIKHVCEIRTCNRSSEKGRKGNIVTLGRYRGGVTPTCLKMDNTFDVFTMPDYNVYPIWGNFFTVWHWTVLPTAGVNSCFHLQCESE